MSHLDLDALFDLIPEKYIQEQSDIVLHICICYLKDPRLYIQYLRDFDELGIDYLTSVQLLANVDLHIREYKE